MGLQLLALIMVDFLDSWWFSFKEHSSTVAQEDSNNWSEDRGQPHNQWKCQMITDEMHTRCIDKGHNYYPSHCWVSKPELTGIVAITIVMVHIHHSYKANECREADTYCKHHSWKHLKIERNHCKETHNCKSYSKFYIYFFHFLYLFFCFIVEIFPIQYIAIYQ